MKSKAEAIAENILNIILDKVMWNGESPYSKRRHTFDTRE